ncbi:MAG: MBL fold metallo-hydrolase [Desulfuromonas sp.]|nr:MAG: MBL fold metallo-hydrolase [Desulfuromonas sp.]
MEVTLLGTGTSTGIPVPGCDCPVCTSDDPRNNRTRCSLLVRHNGKNILIDTATDLRQQVLREKISRIDAVLLTHTHADHIHGIDDLRPFNKSGDDPIPVYAADEAIRSMRRNFAYIFGNGERSGYCPRLSLHEIDGRFNLCGLEIIPVPLRHGNGNSLGFRFGPIAYLTDCNEIPAAAKSLLNNLEVLIIDALRFRPHTSHFNIAEAIKAAEQIGAKRTLLTHLSHEIEHGKHETGLPDGVEFAFDGQKLHLAIRHDNGELSLPTDPVSH